MVFKKIHQNNNDLYCADGELEISVTHTVNKDLIKKEMNSLRTKFNHEFDKIPLKIERDTNDTQTTALFYFY